VASEVQEWEAEMKLMFVCAAATAALTLSMVAVIPTALAITLCRDGTAMGHDSCRLHGGIDLPDPAPKKIRTESAGGSATGGKPTSTPKVIAPATKQ
jgi:hypothetical protein